jgi:type VI secretion system secreted protein VgrG
MDIPANRACIEFALEGVPYPVIAVNGDERLNQGFYFQIDVQIARHQQVEEFVGRRGLLRFARVDGDQRHIAGIVECAQDVGFDQKAKRIVIGLIPHSRGLEQVRGPTLWLGLDFKGLIKTLLDEASLRHTSELRFDFSHSHPTRPWTLRAPEETSAELIMRRMAHEGIFYRIDQHEGREQLIFTDHNAHCPYVSGGAVRQLAERGQPQTGVFQVAHHNIAEPGATRGYVLPEQKPARPWACEFQASQRPGVETRLGGFVDLPGAEAWSALCDCYNDRQAEYLSILANRTDLAAGHCITLETGPRPGDYLIMGVKHHSAQAAGHYTCEALLAPRIRPFVTAFPPKHKLPPLIGARIESNNSYATLDEFGRYRLRALFETGLSADASASLSLNKQPSQDGPRSPYGKPVYPHAPLQEPQEVLLSCLNNDPEQLMIAIGLYNPNTPSPILDDNLTRNIYRSLSYSTLIMGDTKARELIKLQAVDGLLCLELNSNAASQWVGLTTFEGASEVSAKKT